MTTSGANLVPPELLVGLDVVQNYFPEIEQQTATSENTTASGAPDATRMVIYEGGDGRRVTRRIQPVVATPFRKVECIRSANTSAGVLQPWIFRGRLLSASATA